MVKRYRIIERVDGWCTVQYSFLGIWKTVQTYGLCGTSWNRSFIDKDAAKEWIDDRIKYDNDRKIKSIEEYP